jgi:NTE family protein
MGTGTYWSTGSFSAEGIPIDMVAGTSAGSAIGAVGAQGKDASLLEELAMGLNWKQIVSLVDMALPKTGFIEGKKVTSLLRTIISSAIKFNELKIPLACMAADIKTGEEVIIEHGSVLEGIRVSISIPVILTVAKLQD